MRELCAVKFRKHAHLRRACNPRAFNIKHNTFERYSNTYYVAQMNYHIEKFRSIVIRKSDYSRVNEYSCVI